MSDARPCIILSNDDGYPGLLLPLLNALAPLPAPVLLLAPDGDNSACGQRITLNKPLSLVSLPSPIPHAHLLTLSGTPSDCVATALQLAPTLGLAPHLVVAGPNLGFNLGSDVIYSGTFAAARQAALYGVPALACSMDVSASELHQQSADVGRMVRAVARLVKSVWQGLEGEILDVDRKENLPPGRALREAFVRGDVTFNVNIPREYTAAWRRTLLDSVMYRSPMHIGKLQPKGDRRVKVKGGGGEYDYAEHSDAEAVFERGVGSITAVSTWPVPCRRAVSDHVLREGLGGEAPEWLGGSDYERVQINCVEDDGHVEEPIVIITDN